MSTATEFCPSQDVRIESNHHSVTMVHILRNLHQPPVLAGTVIFAVLCFHQLQQSQHMTTHVQEQVGSSSGATTFYLPVTYPGDIRKIIFQVRCHGDLLGLVVADDGFIREQMDKATYAISFVFPAGNRLTQRGLAQSPSITLLAITFYLIMLTKCASFTNLTIPFSYTMGAPCTPTTRFTSKHIYVYRERTQPSPTTLTAIMSQ